MTFSAASNAFGKEEVVPLKENGLQTPVTDDNKREYVELITEFMLTKACLPACLLVFGDVDCLQSIKQQIGAFLKGFQELISPELISIFNEQVCQLCPHWHCPLPACLPAGVTQEMELLICGLPDIDVQDLRANTDYSGYQSTDQVVQWFWQVVGDMEPDEKAALAEIGRLWPGVSVVSSHQITREWREYERTNTAVLSAYVQPTAERYLSRLQTGLQSAGFTNSPYIMQSNCGVESLESVSKIPITMVESRAPKGVAPSKTSEACPPSKATSAWASSGGRTV